MKFIISLLCAFISNKNKRQAFRKRAQCWLHFRDVKKINPQILNSIILYTGGGLADQIKILLLAHDMRKKHPNANIVFEIPKYESIIPHGYKLYDFDEISKSFGGANRQLVSGRAKTPFELYKYKIDWTGIKLASFPGGIEKVFKDANCMVNFFRDIPVILEPPMYLQHASVVPDNYLLEPKSMKYLEQLGLAIELDDRNKNKLSEIKSANNSICIHIRRGDYIRQIKGKTVSGKYFHNAIDGIMNRAGWESATCFVFSDDKKWARSAIDFKIPGKKVDVDFVDINDIDAPEREIELMRSCKNFIVSVGHFGLLAFAMCKNPNKILIVPNEKDFEYIGDEDLSPERFSS